MDTFGVLAALCAGSVLAAGHAEAQTIALEHYLGAPDELAYSGSFELDTAAGDISGLLYRHGGMQRMDGWRGMVPIWVIVDVEAGSATVASPLTQSYVTLPLSAPTVRDYIPDPRTHANVQIARSLERDEDDGLIVELHRITGETVDGTGYMAEITQSVDGVIIAVDGETEMGGRFGFELEYHQIGPVDPGVFELPETFQPAPSLAAVVTPRG